MEFCHADAVLPTPPVPPRRKKNKARPKEPISLPIKSQFSSSGSKRRPAPALPPAASQKIGRTTTSFHPNEGHSSSTGSSSLQYAPESLDSTGSNSLISCPVKVAPSKPQRSPRNKHAENSIRNDVQISRVNSPFISSREPSPYPPLLFTLEDYESVMEKSLTAQESLIEKNVNNHKSLEIKSDLKETEVVEEISLPTESTSLPNMQFSSEREEFYFCITTTDKPFQKNLGSWGLSLDDDTIDKSEEEQHSGAHIFEDYIDRSNRMNARPDLFSKDFTSLEDVSTERTATRVRFVVESPSTSTPDADLMDDGITYKDFFEKKFAEAERSTVKLTEVTDDDVSDLENDSCDDKNFNENSEVLADNKIEPKIQFQLGPKVEKSRYGELYVDAEKDSEQDISGTVDVRDEVDNILKLSLETDDAPEEQIKPNKKVEENKSCIDCVNKSENKIYIHPSLYHLLNDDEDWEQYIDDTVDDVKSDNECDIKEIIDDLKCNETSSDIKNEQTNSSENPENSEIQSVLKEEQGLSESIRRNVFLNTMLDDHNFEKNSLTEKSANCEVIATHPKPAPTPFTTDEQNSEQLSDAILVTDEAVPSNNSKKITLKETGAPPNSQNKMETLPSGNKSVGEARSDMLNELLTNFESIKLKSVKNLVDNLPISSEETQKDTPPINSVTQKTDVAPDATEIFVQKTTTSLRSRSKKPAVATESRGTDPIPDVPSAIIDETLNSQRSDNDNKAMATVDCNDQSSESISIAPGSVKNFVMYYEIHSELSTVYKMEESAFSRRKHELAKEYKKLQQGSDKKSIKSGEKVKSKLPNLQLLPDKKKKNDKAVENTKSKSKVVDHVPTPCLKNVVANQPKSERKKSVQFDGECKVITPRKKDKKKDEEEGTFSTFIGGIRTRLKRNAPAKPEAKKAECSKGLKLDPCPAEAAAIICIQKSPEAHALKYPSISGNRSFLPPNKTLPDNQTIVFYCTV
ncbi:uncharacterized protein LOC106650976 [Trichogramma pretiosum]|uniref:uncharacterized protein LOC106650976 n=1 Tax=Trichogramma pretiosum TaxID=7493 RepID=UPI0006C9AB0A|nr:uncharacterized protein LOC106650976 [Trichogramma pretiosum]